MVYKELFTDFFKQNRTIFILFISITLLTFPVETIFIPTLYGELSTSISLNKTSKILRKIGKIILFIIGLWLSIQAFYYIKNIILGKIISKYLVFLRKKMFIKVIENNEIDYKDLKITKNISRIFELSNELKEVVYYFLDSFLPLIMTIIVVSIYLFFVDWKMGLICIVCITAYFLFFYYYGKRIIDVSSETQKHYLDMTNIFNDSFENLMNIYLNNQKKSEEMKLQKYLDEYLISYRKQMNMLSTIMLVISVYSIFIFSLIIGFSFWNYKNNKINGKKFIILALISMFFVGYLLDISSMGMPELLRMGILKNSMPFLENIFVNNEKNYIKNPNLNGDIIFDKINYAYSDNDGEINIIDDGEDNKINVFTNFSLIIKKEQKTALLGTSGSGKTTLIKLILKLHSIQEGNILINGIPIQKINPVDLRNSINYVNQRTGLFQGSVLNNIKYGNKYDDKKIIELLEKYGFMHNFKILKNGVYSDVGVNGKNVSLGMQKIIMNVRGILKKSDVIVFDEPLAGLDSNSRKNTIKLIDEFCKGKTVIVITHDKEILEIMDKVVDLNKIQSAAGTSLVSNMEEEQEYQEEQEE
jgi:ABC-type multidrug transport system fused ATPase/permease subunit